MSSGEPTVYIPIMVSCEHATQTYQTATASSKNLEKSVFLIKNQKMEKMALQGPFSVLKSAIWFLRHQTLLLLQVNCSFICPCRPQLLPHPKLDRKLVMDPLDQSSEMHTHRSFSFVKFTRIKLIFWELKRVFGTRNHRCYQTTTPALSVLNSRVQVICLVQIIWVTDA